MIATLLWELRLRRTALFWWTLGSVLMTVVILALYPSIRDKANELNQALNQLPAGFRQLKTGGSGAVNVADPVAFLNSQLFYATLPILWIILDVTRGGAILGKDEQNHTLELLLARPISRTRLLLAKALSLVAEFVIVAGITLVTIVLIAPAFSLHVGTGRLAITTAYTAAFSLSFGLIAFGLQAANTLARRSATAVAVFVGFGGYLISSLSGLTDWLTTPAKLAPYHYFTPDQILRAEPVRGLDVYLVGTLVIMGIIALLGFRRRDIS